MTLVPVTFQYQGEPGQRIELAGDFPDWKARIPMAEELAGLYRCRLELAPGIYRYKFVRDGRVWLEVPDAPAVDGAEGVRNAVRVVGGTEPPLFFAPDRRHRILKADGTFAIHAEVEEGARPPEHVWLRGAGAERPVALARVGRRGGRVQLRASGRLPESGSGWSFRFDAVDPRFALGSPRPALGEAPPWVRGAVFYAIFLDRWRRGRGSPARRWLQPRSVPSDPWVSYGGDLAGVTESLDELVALGITALVLTPVHPSPTPHRYDATDLHAVDPLLGGPEALARLFDQAHRRGLRVVVDLSVTHVNYEHPAFQEVLREQQGAARARWFKLRRFPVVADEGATYEHYYDRTELPLLDLRPGPAREHAIEAALALVRAGADGLRLDAMDDAPPDFWQELRARVRALEPGVLLMGEVVSDSAARFAEERGVDLATDFQHREAMEAFFARGRVEAAEFFARTEFARHRLGPFDPGFHLLFADNHDTRRFLTVARDPRRLRLALAYLLFRPEPVWLTYGTELGMCSDADGDLPLDHAWTERIPMPQAGDAQLEREPARALREAIRAGCALRRGALADCAEAVTLGLARGRLLALRRASPRGEIWGLFNASDDVAQLPEAARGGEVLARFGEGAEGAGPLGPWEARLVRVGRGGAAP